MNDNVILAQCHIKRAGFTLDVDLSLPGKGVSVFYGHSGSGKTTLLRCIAGLEKIKQGNIRFNGSTWQSSQSFVPTYKRPLAYVFQEASLFQHLNGQENLEFAIKRAPSHRENIQSDHIVELLGIGNILDRYPSQMSGGERQRVAIARALLAKPELL